jgi:hypothetical protein
VTQLDDDGDSDPEALIPNDGFAPDTHVNMVEKMHTYTRIVSAHAHSAFSVFHSTTQLGWLQWLI